MPPTPTNGKICYIEIPAVDVQRSARFYEQVFGWRIRQRGDGSVSLCRQANLRLFMFCRRFNTAKHGECPL